MIRLALFLGLLSATAAAAQPTVSLAPANGDEITTTVDIVVTLSGAHTQAITVVVSGAEDTAFDPEDFDGSAVTVVIAAGATSGVASFDVVDDDLHENIEVFTASIDSAVDATAVVIAVVGAGAVVGTIVDDDLPPGLRVVSADGPNVVGANADFTVSLVEVAGRDVAFTLRPVNGTAVAPGDFNGADIAGTITAGNLNANIAVPVVNDALDEDDEAFSVTLVGVAGATFDGNDASIVIVDDDPSPDISLGDDVTVNENGTVSVRVDLSTASGRDVTFTLRPLTDQAVADEDFVGDDIVDVIAAGATFVDVDIPLIDDAIDEEDQEDFTVLLALADNATITTNDDETVVTIDDDDDPPSISVVSRRFDEEAAVVAVTLSLSGASARTITIDVDTASGTALAGTDFTDFSVNNLSFAPGVTNRTVDVTVREDTLDENDETFAVALSNPGNVTLGADGTVTIDDDDDPPTMAVNSPDPVVEGANAPFILTLSAASGLPITVDVSALGGTATAGADFTAPTGVRTIAPGVLTLPLPVTTVNDALDENDGETFTIELSNPVNCTIIDGSGTGTINDNDNPPSLSIVGDSVTEGDAGTTAMNFVLTLSAPSGRALSVTANTVAVSADAGTDFIAVVGSVVTFAAGVTDATVVVDAVGETTRDRVANETFTVALSAPVNVTLATSSATGTITDNDPEPRISIADAILPTEGAANATALPFTVSLDRRSELAVQVSATPSFGGGSTASSTDVFVQSIATVVPALALETTADVLVLGDTVDEVNETFVVTLASPVNGTIDDGSAIGTINDDDDPPTLSIGNATIDEDAAEIVFAVTLSARSGLPASATFTTVAGSAAAGADFVATSGTTTVAANQLDATVRIALLDDALHELNETFSVVLSAPVNCGILDGEGVGTLDDDENPPDLTIDDAVAVAEGDSGSIDAVFRVSLSAVSGRTVTLPVRTVTATAGAADFTAVDTTVTLAAGVTEAFVAVSVAGDRLDETNETFRLDAQAGVAGATVVDGSAAATIIDDDDSPLAGDDVYSTDEEVLLTVAAVAGLLQNDSDGDNDALSVVVVDAPAADAGTLQLSANGSFTFDPASDFAGAVDFTYSVSDGVNSTIGAVDIFVANINDAPSVVDTAVVVRVDEDDFANAGVLVSGLVAAIDDRDPQDGRGIALVATGAVDAGGAFEFSEDGSNFIAVGSVDDVNALLLSANGTTRLRLVPPPDFNGTVVVQYVAWDLSDGNVGGSTADTSVRGNAEAFSIDVGEISFVVAEKNDPPRFVAPTPDAAVAVLEGQRLVITLNAFDTDGPAETFSLANNTLPVTAVFDAAAGTLTWTPTFDEAGSYTVDAIVDDSLLQDRRTLTINATFIDADDDDVPDTVEATLGTSVGSNDSDGDGILDLEEIGPNLLAPADSDDDGVIDARDDDSDDDGVLDEVEAGDALLNTPRVDSDGDGIADALDDDSDDDDVIDGDDNCRTVDNDQNDLDDDLVGDACDDDRDGDGLLNRDEPDLALDADDPDTDDDTILDGVEAPRAVGRDTNDDGVIDALDDDSDGDGTSDADEAGDAQLFTEPRDTDGDGDDDYIDTDSDNDGDEDDVDNCIITDNPGQEDLDEDGVGDACLQVCGDNTLQFGEECDDESDERCGNDCKLVASDEVCDGIDNDLDGKIDIIIIDGDGDDDGERSACADELEVEGGGILGVFGCSSSGGFAVFFVLAFLLHPRLRRREAALLLLVGVAGTARAEGVAVAPFAPAPGGTVDFVLVEGTGTAGHLAPAGALTFDYGNGALRVSDQRTGAEVALLEHRVTADLAASLSLFDLFVVSLGLPVSLFQSAGVDDTFKPLVLAPVALGDARVSARLSILNPRTGPAAALSLTATMPTSGVDGPANLLGHGDFTVRPTLIGGWNFGERFRVTGNVGYFVRPEQTLFGLTVGNELTFAVGAQLPLPVAMPTLVGSDAGALSALIEVNGRISASLTPTLQTSPLETQAAARWEIGGGHAVTAGLGLGITPGYGTPLVRAFAAYSFTWPVTDTDKDGIADDKDGCPDRAEDKDGHDDDDGCPGDDEEGEQVVDPDDDGLTAPADLCPDEPEDKDGFEDGDGCPDTDHDGDGVAQDLDKCADVPEDRDGFADDDGCPDDDNDGDGFKDVDDKCKNAAELRNGFEDDDGCPDVPPTATPETKPEPPKLTPEGKPEPPPFMNDGRIELPQRIYFTVAGADLTSEGTRLLAQVAQTLRDNPGIRIEVQGHTDGQGEDLVNDRLALRRAEAIANYLVRQGIERQRLLIAILGSVEPLAPNDTPRGRALNRRVEFRVLDR